MLKLFLPFLSILSQTCIPPFPFHLTKILLSIHLLPALKKTFALLLALRTLLLYHVYFPHLLVRTLNLVHLIHLPLTPPSLLTFSYHFSIPSILSSPATLFFWFPLLHPFLSNLPISPTFCALFLLTSLILSLFGVTIDFDKMTNLFLPFEIVLHLTTWPYPDRAFSIILWLSLPFLSIT